MIAERVAARRASQGGQIVTLVVLTMGTMAVMGMVAITFGQALVRRQQAQLVVDAAALAGAAEQAKGLNTIARINKRQLDFVNALSHAQTFGIARGFVDDSGTTWARMARLLCGPCVGDDWAYENWEKYQDDVFEPLNRAARAVNFAYMPRGKPKRAAQKIIEDNFTKSNSLFKNEEPDSGIVIPWHEAGYSERLYQLVELSEPLTYAIGGARRYKAHSGHYTMTCIEWYGPIPDPVCIAARKARAAAYLKENGILSGSAAFGHRADFQIGQFYATPKSRDIRFTYYLTVDLAKPIFGADYLKDIPKITVVASAKPYAGHLGNEFPERLPWLRIASLNLTSYGFDQEEGKEISATYRAKLVPVRLVDRLHLATIAGEGSDDADRFISAFH